MKDKFANKNELVSGIFKQAKGEEDAKMEYMEFLACADSMLSEKDRATIKEIVADEQNHTIKLLAMARKYSGISATDDDLAEALAYLSK